MGQDEKMRGKAMFEYRTVRCWTAAGTMDKVESLRADGWELVSTHPRFVLFFELFGLQALLRRDVTDLPTETEWSPNQ